MLEVSQELPREVRTFVLEKSRVLNEKVVIDGEGMKVILKQLVTH